MGQSAGFGVTRHGVVGAHAGWLVSGTYPAWVCTVGYPTIESPLSSPHRAIVELNTHVTAWYSPYEFVVHANRGNHCVIADPVGPK